MSSLQLLLPVFSSVVGVALSLLLLLLLAREPQKDTAIKVGMLLAAAVFVFFGALCESAVLTFLHTPRSSGVWKISADTLAVSAAILPSLVLWSWHTSPVMRWRSRKSGILLLLSWLWTACVLFLALFKPGPKEVSYLNQVVGISSIVSLAPACISILCLPLNPRLHAFLRTICLIYLATACLSIFVLPWSSRPTVLLLFISLIRFILLLIALMGSFILAARFRYADVFLRVGTQITAIGIIALTGALFFSSVLEPSFKNQSSLALLSLTFLISALLFLESLALPSYISSVERCVLGKVDLRDALICLRRTLFSHNDHSSLFVATQAALQEALRVAVVEILDVDAVSSYIAIGGDTDRSFIEISPWSVSYGPNNDTTDQYAAPIKVGGTCRYVAVISLGLRRRILVQSEIGFVEKVCEELGLRLDQLDVESAVHLQSVKEFLLRQQIVEAELSALRAQVNPHFLFNSLNTIADLIVRDPEKAERLTVHLGDVFRHVLARSNKQFVSLSEEFSFLRHYLEIEKERFGDDLEVAMELPSEASHTLIPSLLLQPLVENAIKHGLMPKLARRKIVLRAVLKGSRIHLEVSDNGVGFPQATMFPDESGQWLKEAGIGLTNTYARLKTAFGPTSELELRSEPMSGCSIMLSFEARPVCDV